MAGTPVTVLARIKARSGKEKELRQALEALLAPTRAEEGCLNYDLHQMPDDPSEFMFYENWTSKACLDRHQESSHLAAFRSRAGDLLAGPVDLTLWERIP